MILVIPLVFLIGGFLGWWCGQRRSLNELVELRRQKQVGRVRTRKQIRLSQNLKNQAIQESHELNALIRNSANTLTTTPSQSSISSNGESSCKEKSDTNTLTRLQNVSATSASTNGTNAGELDELYVISARVKPLEYDLTQRKIEIKALKQALIDMRRINEKHLVSVRLQAENQTGLQFKEKLAEKQKQIDSMVLKSAEVSNSQARIHKLQTELGRMLVLERERDQLRDQSESQLCKIRALVEQSSYLESQVVALQNELDRLKLERGDHNGLYDQLNTKIVERETLLVELREKLSIVDKKNLELSDNNEQQYQELALARRQLGGTLDNLNQSERRVAELQKQTGGLNKQLISRSSELELLRSTLAKKDKHMDNFRKHSDRAMSFNSADNSIVAENLILDERSNDAHELEQSREEIKKLNLSLEKVQFSASVAKKNDIEVRRLHSEIMSLQSERDNANNKVVSLERRIQEQELQLVTNKQLSYRVQELESVEADNERLESQLADLNIRLKRLQNTTKSSGGSSKKKKENTNSHTRVTPLYAAPTETDDLKKINGIGPVMERVLNSLGITTYKQLAEFKSDDIRRVTDAIEAFPGRIERDNWVGGAKEQYQLKYKKADA